MHITIGVLAQWSEGFPLGVSCWGVSGSNPATCKCGEGALAMLYPSNTWGANPLGHCQESNQRGRSRVGRVCHLSAAALQKKNYTQNFLLNKIFQLIHLTCEFNTKFFI